MDNTHRDAILVSYQREQYTGLFDANHGTASFSSAWCSGACFFEIDGDSEGAMQVTRLLQAASPRPVQNTDCDSLANIRADA